MFTVTNVPGLLLSGLITESAKSHRIERSTSASSWLSARGIHPRIASKVCLTDGSLLLYPRLFANLIDVAGWKARNMESGATWNTARGIRHGETLPLTIGTGKHLLICEGETDMMCAASHLPLHKYAIICTPGATSFPTSWVPLTQSYQQVTVIPDGDEAGKQMAERICGMIPRARSVGLSDGLDVCKVIANGCELEPMIERALPIQVSAPVRRNSVKMNMQGSDYRDKLAYIVSRRVRLRKRGAELVGLCPFHNEKTPSFTVNPDKGLFFCHGCRKGGDAITFLRETENIGFKEAMRLLEEVRC